MKAGRKPKQVLGLAMEISGPIGLGQYEFMKAVGCQGKARNILYGLRLLVSIGNRINER